jgi:surface protein
MSLPSLIVNNLGYLNLSHLLRNSARALAVVTLTLSLAACGGGSSSGGDSSDGEVIIEDTTAPVITLNGESEITIELNSVYSELAATATDDTDGDVEVTISGEVNTSEIGTYTITYTASDAASNTATATRTVNVNVNVVDTTPPVITLMDDSEVHLVQNNTFSVYEETDATAFDNIDGEVDVVITNDIDTTTVGSYTVTYTATDSSGNEAVETRSVNVVEPTPFITTWKTNQESDNSSNDSEDNQIKIGTYGDGYNFTIDWGDGTIEENQTKGKTHTYDVAGTYTIKITGQFPRLYFSSVYSGYDNDKILSVEQWGNNIWQSMERAFYYADNVVFNATDIPDLSQVTSVSGMFRGSEFFNSNISDWDVSNVTDMSYMFSDATAFNQDISQWTVSNVTDMSYMFSDATAFNKNISGWNVSNVTNMRNSFSKAITFNQDLSGWDVSNVTDIYYMLNEAALSIDNYDALLIAWSKQTLQSGLRFRATSYYSESAKSARDVIRNTYGWSITADELWEDTDVDTDEPEIELYGNRIVTISVGSTYVESGAFAIDELDGSLDIVITGVLDINTIGSYTLTYTATDNAGNEDSTTRTINVVEVDVVDPIITLKGDSTITLEQDETYIDPGVTAVDARDGVLTPNIIGKVEDKITGTYTLTYTVTDSAGNSASVDRTVVVPLDTTDPVISLIGDEIVKLDVNSGDYIDAGATAIDWRDGDVTVTIISNDVDMTSVSTSYEVVYQATDAAGNVGEATRYVQVLNPDIKSPAIAITSGDSIEWTVGFDYNDFGASAYDERDGEVTVTQTNDIDTSTTGTYTVTYTATDAAGNESTATRTVDVVAATPFTTTWDIPANFELTIPTTGTGYNYSINWGDGNTDTNQTGDATHTYLTEGEYTIEITGPFPRLYINNNTTIKDKIISVEQWGNNIWSSMVNTFNGAVNLTINASDSPVLHQVTNMTGMFSGATSFNSDISDWDVSNVMHMSSMFSGATAFNQDISNWDVSNVATMTAMFREATVFNQDLSAWNDRVSQVTDMRNMFSYTEQFNGDITGWDVSGVTTMTAIFNGAIAFNQDISGWDVSNIKSMYLVFSNADSFNQNLNQWDVSNVTSFRSMFSGADKFNGDITEWDVSSATEMHYMFYEAQAFNQDIGKWNDLSNVENMGYMFKGAIAFNQDISRWDVSSVTTMAVMFEGATSFDQNIGQWNMSNVTNLYHLFYDANLSTANYDALLIGWSAQSLQINRSMTVHSSYSSAAASAKEYIENAFGWYITDNGEAP